MPSNMWYDGLECEWKSYECVYITLLQQKQNTEYFSPGYFTFFISPFSSRNSPTIPPQFLCILCATRFFFSSLCAMLVCGWTTEKARAAWSLCCVLSSLFTYIWRYDDDYISPKLFYLLTLSLSRSSSSLLLRLLYVL